MITVDEGDHLLALTFFVVANQILNFSVVPLNKTFFEHEQECFQSQHFLVLFSNLTVYMIVFLKTSLTSQCKTQNADYCVFSHDIMAAIFVS